jgi:ribosomal protection tetracycline resistance protein
MRTLNLGILAHVDAGKTTLTERLLYAAGVIDEIGSVDHGTTRTDTLDLERQRGITIKSAVVSFIIGDDVAVNLIDTPGHPDFIAEVERVLDVLDGAVLVISAVEGVQSQTRILMRTLQRLRIPTLLFVNKIDRNGAGVDRTLRGIDERLTPSVVAMGEVHDEGTKAARFTLYGPDDDAFPGDLVERLAEHDDALLAAAVDDASPVRSGRLRAELATQTARTLVHPVFFGSAITGTGVDALTAGIAELLPAATGDADGALSGTVFKVERGPAGERIAYVRVFSGTIRTRDRLAVRTDDERKVTAIRVFDQGSDVQRPSVTAGEIAKVWGLGDVRIGDALGEPRPGSRAHHFAPPTLETIVEPRRPSDGGPLFAALAQLAEQDPLINVRRDDVRGETSVSLYGEVQKEVIQATLADGFGIDVGFRPTTTICIERPLGTGAAVERLHQEPNPFLATVGLRVEPAPAGSGVTFRVEAELGSMPLAFFRATEDTVRETLQQGLYGWEVTDCAVAMTDSGYMGKHGIGHQDFNKSISSTGEDFRFLTPLVLMTALQEAGTTVCEPIHRFRLEIPADTLGSVASVLARMRAVPRTQEMRGPTHVMEGDIPAAQIHSLQQRLSSLTRGEGVLESTFDRFEPVGGAIPSRKRTDRDPLDRKAYLLRVTRKV